MVSPGTLRRGGSGVVACLLCAACGHEVAAPPAAHAETKAPPAAAKATATATDAAAQPTARPVGVSGAAVPDDAPRFAAVARRVEAENGSIALLEASDGQVFAAVGPALYRLGSDGSISGDLAWVRGVEADFVGDMTDFGSGMYWWDALAIGGGWPDSAYLVLVPGAAARAGGGPPALYRREGEAWRRVAARSGKLHWYPRRFGAWKDGSILALKGFHPTYALDGDEPTPAEARAFAGLVAREKRLIVLRGAPKAPAFGSRDVQAFASLASGQIFALVQDGARLVALHHDEATGERTLPLPGAAGGRFADVDVRATAPDRVWAFGGWAPPDAETRPYLARFDGTAWTEVDSRCAGPVISLSIDREGAAYFVCAVRPAAGEPRPVLFRVRAGVLEELPTDAPPGTVVARGPDDVWVLTEPSTAPALLLHGGPARGEPAALPSTMTVAEAVYAWAEPRPVDGSCPAVWVPAAPGADLAAVKRALEGLSGEDVDATARTVRVQGRVETGVSIVALRPAEVKRAVKAVQARLGATAGAPTCNERPDAPAP